MSDTNLGLFDFSDEYDPREDARQLAEENNELRLEIEHLKSSNKTRRAVVAMEHAHNDNISICSAGPTLYSIYIDRTRGTAKLECYPQYLYFESIEEARDIRDMLNALIELNPAIKPNVPRFSSAPFARKDE